MGTDVLMHGGAAELCIVDAEANRTEIFKLG
jgi:hypothetical protein